MKNKLLYFLVLATVVGLSLTALYLLQKDSGEKVSSNSSFANEYGKSKLIVGIDDAFPPNTFRDESGEIVGLDVDLAKEAAKRLDVEVQFQPVEWDGIIPALEGKRVDIIWSGMGITDERKVRVDFAVIGKGKGGVFFVNASSNIDSKDDLKGKVVGVQSGSYQETDLKEDPIATSLKEIRSTSSLAESLLDLKSGRLDAVLANETASLYYMQSTFGTTKDFKIVDAGYDLMYQGVAMRKDEDYLEENLKRVIMEIIDDGTASEISKKWLGVDSYNDWDWDKISY